MKNRVHNEWFRPVVRKSCPCGSNRKRNAPKNQVWAWGEYVAARWYTVDYFCEKCFQERVVPRLRAHAGECGCSFELKAKSGHGELPPWLRLQNACASPAASKQDVASDSAVVAALMSSPWEQMQQGVM